MCPCSETSKILQSRECRDNSMFKHFALIYLFKFHLQLIPLCAQTSSLFTHLESDFLPFVLNFDLTWQNLDFVSLLQLLFEKKYMDHQERIALITPGRLHNLEKSIIKIGRPTNYSFQTIDSMNFCPSLLSTSNLRQAANKTHGTCHIINHVTAGISSTRKPPLVPSSNPDRQILHPGKVISSPPLVSIRRDI